MIERIKSKIISPDDTILDAIKQMDEVKVKTLLVFDKEHLRD